MKYPAQGLSTDELRILSDATSKCRKAQMSGNYEAHDRALKSAGKKLGKKVFYNVIHCRCFIDRSGNE